jgi:hypothetical protein
MKKFICILLVFSALVFASAGETVSVVLDGLHSTGVLSNGKRVGTWFTYNPLGTVVYITIYNENGSTQRQWSSSNREIYATSDAFLRGDRNDDPWGLFK